jgi:gliding motility-associated-like protein
VFELCNVFAGGGLTGSTTACPTLALVPSPACPPPYKSVPFNGTYTAQNPLPVSAQLYLDPDSGHFYGTPSQIGQYILGICVKEYRDGVLLSTFLIDYQFHAVSCLVTRSDMLTPAEDPLMLCNGLTIDFLDQSVNASDLKWDFGDPSSTLDTSTSTTPQYTYPIPGVYPVTLITEPNNPYCSDTLVVDFPVRERVVPAFIWDGNVCFENNEVSFAPIGYYPSDVKFEWEFGPLANPPSAKSKNPPMVSWSQPGFYNVQFAVLYDSCRQEHTQILEIKDLAQVLEAGPDQIDLKPGEVADLEASGAVRYYWYAENGTEFSSRITAKTSVRMDSRDSLKVYVKGWSVDGCSSIDSLYLIVPRNEALSAPINFFTPNKDGVNDVFNLAEFNPDNCAISILNRWGVEVWQEDVYKNDWTGLDFGGDELPDGTYYYILQCDEKVKLKAAVTLIRDTSKN